MDIEQYIYEIEVEGTMYYLCRQRPLSLLILNRLALVESYESMWDFAKRYDLFISRGIGGEVVLVSDQTFTDGVLV